MLNKYKRNLVSALAASIFLVFVVVPTGSVRAQEPLPTTVSVGMFINAIYNIDFYNEKFETVFWLWFIFDDPEFDPVSNIEIVNAQSHDVLEHYRETRSDGRQYISAKVRAVINQPWELDNYPFDTQRLVIAMESTDTEADTLRFIPDLANSVIGPEVHLHGWDFGDLRGANREFTYNTTFGAESALHSTYSRVEFFFDISRGDAKLFFEVYVGYFIAVMMCIAIWMSARYRMPEYRIGLILAAIFAAIGNKNVLESNLPTGAHFGLEDVIEISTFLLISASLILAVLCERLHLSDNARMAGRLSVAVFPVLFLFYFSYVSYHAYHVINHKPQIERAQYD